MLETQSRPRPANGAPPPVSPNGGAIDGAAPPGIGETRLAAPESRSHLLRRTPRVHYFIDENEERDGIRIRRERRVNGSFSAIPTLARKRGR